MSCAEQTNVIIAPGPGGKAGTDGTNGTNGVNAYTATTATFLMPAELSTVSVSVGDTSWMVVGQKVFVGVAGYMDVQSITDATTVVLTNAEDTALGLYNINATPGTNIPTPVNVAPGGIQGPAGSLTGSAGGELAGTYPNPTVNVLSAKGQIFGHDGAGNIARAAGADKTLLHADSAQASGLDYRGVDLTGTNTTLSGNLPVSKGGTGSATATAGFDALSPLTTQGDLLVGGASGTGTRLGIGANGTVPVSNGSTLVYQTLTTLVNGLQIIESNTGGATQTITDTPGANDQGVAWVDTSGTAVVALTLPDANNYVVSGGGKFLITTQDYTGTSTTPQATDAGGNGLVGANALVPYGGANAWQGKVWMVVTTGAAKKWLNIATF